MTSRRRHVQANRGWSLESRTSRGPFNRDRGARDGEAGSVLILALVYIVAISLIVGALTSWAMNDLNNTGKFNNAKALASAASNATDVAIQNIRYTPMLGTGQTINASPPTYCWGSGPLSQITTNSTSFGQTTPITMDVWCSTAWTPTSAISRTVTFYTCLASVTAAACAQSPFLTAQVQYDDYPAGLASGSAPIQGPCTLFCGQGITVVYWIWGTAANVSNAGVAVSAKFTTEPSSTTVGVVTSAAVTVLDANNTPVVGDSVSVFVNTGPPGATLTGTLSATTNGSGIAFFTNLVPTVAGRYTLEANDGSVVAPPSTTFNVAQAANAITVTSPAPTGAAVGGNYTPTASATSGDPVAITVDNSTSSICSIAAGLVTFNAGGNCLLDFNDVGTVNYKAATQVQQTVKVFAKQSVIKITSTAPASAAVGGATYTPTATATSGDTVAITVDSSSASVCAIAGGKVSFNSSGNCTVNYNDAGNAGFAAANQMQQTFPVGLGANAIAVKSANPSPVKVGATYTPTATATSGDAVAITVDSSSTSVCSIAAGLVTFNAAGNCTLDFNDPGNANFGAANQATQSITVANSFSGGSNGNMANGTDYYPINSIATGSGTQTANGFTTLLPITLTGLTFTLNGAAFSATTVTVGTVSGGAFHATGLTCSIPAGQTTCTIALSVSELANTVINVRGVAGFGSKAGSWSVSYTQP
jgi:hypothetical protein